MFDPAPKARADLKPGTMYAVTGEAGWIYYGQMTSEKWVGFFNYRTRKVAPTDDVLDSPAMAVVPVMFPSVGRALRSGRWKKLEKRPLHENFVQPIQLVQWPSGTLKVSVWVHDAIVLETTVDDSRIQDFERAAAWDAEHHIPARLTADFGEEEPEWHVGGPIWRERKVLEEYARRCPDQPWHQLPTGWISTDG